MWPTVLFLAFCAATDPVRIGVTAVVVALPRPMHHLFVYWLGLMTMAVGSVVAGLFLLRDFLAPVTRFVDFATNSPVIPPIQIAGGVLALSCAAMLVMRSSTRQAVLAPQQGGDSTVVVQEPETPKKPTVFARLSWPHLVKRGSTGMSFLAGLSTSTPPVEFWGAITAIVISRAAMGTQLSAAIVLVLVSLAIAEIPLLAYLASPAKTQAVVTQVNCWLRAHRGPVFRVMLGLFGAWMLVQGVGYV